MKELAERLIQNPLVRPENIRPSQDGLKVVCVMNPGAFRYDGKTWLLLRVAERPEQQDGYTSFPVIQADGSLEILRFKNTDPKLNLADPRIINYDGQDYVTTLSHLRLVSSSDGVQFKEDPDRPPLMGQGELETLGIEDCRVARIGQTYYLTYSAASPNGVTVGMRSTRDWKTFTRHGAILPPHNKDCSLFEETINGKYYSLHRPSSPMIGGNYAWIADSPDLEHWGHHRCVLRTRPGMWDSARVGAGASPIRTERGWLVIYHGATKQDRYCLGALLLDLEEPWKVLARSLEPIMEPVAEYERTGFFGNVVFTNGHVVDGDTVTVYYGAADTVVCGARFSMAEILRTLEA